MFISTSNLRKVFNISYRIIYSGIENDIIFFVEGCQEIYLDINYVEHIQITFSLDHSKRGDLSINIISPSGTVSPILDNRNEDDSNLGFSNWTMTSVHFWGENPRGKWLVKFKDGSIYTNKRTGFIRDCILKVHGTNQITYYQTLFQERMKSLERRRNLIHRINYYRHSKIPLEYSIEKTQMIKDLLNYISYLKINTLIKRIRNNIQHYQNLGYQYLKIRPFNRNIFIRF